MEEPYSYQAAPPNNGMAIASLVASILGVTFLPTLGSIIGLILGYVAKRQIAESMGAQGGEGLARWGIILGWIGVGLAVVGVCIVVAVFLASGGITACALMGNTY